MTILGLTIYQIAEFFLIYSFLGWCLEVIYAAIKTGTVINRGFLNGPVCPIYGFGVVAIFGLIGAIGSSVETTVRSADMQFDIMGTIGLFIGGVILSTLIELLGGWALDKLFHTRWWDYSQRRFNFHGYICLRFSILWGIGIVLVVRVIHPIIADASAHAVPQDVGWILMAILYAVYVVDVTVSAMIMAGLNREIAELDRMREDMRRISDELSTRLGEGTLETAGRIDEAKLQAALGRKEIEQDLAKRHEEIGQDLAKRREETQNRIEEARSHLAKRVRAHSIYGTGRLLRAFPDMKHHDHPDLLRDLKKLLEG